MIERKAAMPSGWLSRRRFLQETSLLLLTPCLGGCEYVLAKPLTLAMHPWPGYECVFLAAREGWLRADRVRLHETSTANESLALLQAEQVDGAALTLDEVLRARAEGMMLTVVMIFNISAGADKIMARLPLDDLMRLRGHRVAVEKGAVGMLVLHHALARGGLRLADIEPVFLPPSRHLEAFVEQRADAFVTYEPYASLLRQQGAVSVFDSRKMPNMIVDVLALRSDRVKSSYAQAIRHVVEAHFKAHRHLHVNPRDAAFRMAGHLQLAPNEVLSAFKGLVLPNAKGNCRLLMGKAPPLFVSAQEINAHLQDFGLIERPASLTGLINAAYLPACV